MPIGKPPADALYHSDHGDQELMLLIQRQRCEQVHSQIVIK